MNFSTHIFFRSLNSFSARIIWLCCVLLPVYSYGQDDLPCADEIFQSLQFNDPVFKAEFTKINTSISKARNAQAVDDLYVIPIAVHVIHLGEPVGTGSNISDQQIIDAVRGANERWRNLAGNSLDMKIEFCLAQYDPQGNPSTGIDRVDGSSLANYKDYGISYVGALGQPGSDELATKNLLNWPHDYVFNIWVVHRIAGDWGGYAFFPFTFNYPTDGVVITDNSMTYASTTLAHELGHGMGLFHTFQGDDNGCPSNNLCFLEGDWVCDTPPHKKPDCSSPGYTCSNSPDSLLVNSFKNFMSYCGGRYLFTPGQKERSRLAIKSSTRWPLMRSYACTGPPCDTMRTLVHTQTCDLSAAGTHYDTLSTSKGCDSIVTTIATYVPPVTTQLTAITCNALAAGIHYDTLMALSTGCDSILKTTTTYIAPVTTALTATTCDAVAAGIHYDTLVATLTGCDSILQTTTTLIPAPDADFSFVINGATVTFQNISLNGVSYIWDFDDDSSSTLSDPTHEYLSGGNYTVSLIAQNSCSSDTAYKDVNIVLTGIKNKSNFSDLLVYPNPNSGSFIMRMDISETSTLEVINVLGQTIEQQILAPGKEHSISLQPNLSKGIYQLVVKKEGEIKAVSQVAVY